MQPDIVFFASLAIGIAAVYIGGETGITLYALLIVSYLLCLLQGIYNNLNKQSNRKKKG